MSGTQRRRALVLRYVIGDDAICEARPGTFVENDKIMGTLKARIADRDGEPIGGANIPRIL